MLRRQRNQKKADHLVILFVLLLRFWSKERNGSGLKRFIEMARVCIVDPHWRIFSHWSSVWKDGQKPRRERPKYLICRILLNRSACDRIKQSLICNPISEAIDFVTINQVASERFSNAKGRLPNSTKWTERKRCSQQFEINFLHILGARFSTYSSSPIRISTIFWWSILSDTVG